MCASWFELFAQTVLANVHVRYYAVARPSVCRLSEKLVRPTQPVEIFGNISTPYFYAIFLRLGHPLTSTENFTEIVPGEPLRRGWGEVNERGVAKYSDFGPIGGYISETVQDRI